MSNYNNLSLFEQKTVQIALNNLFNKKGHFSISTVRDLIEILNIVPDSNTMHALSLLHCVDYSEMGQEYKQELIQKTLALLQLDWIEPVDEFDPEVNEESEITPKKQPGFIRKLLKLS